MAARISDGEISERRHLVGVGDIVGRRILLRLFFSKDTPAHPRQCSRDATGTEDSPRTDIINCVKLTVVTIDRYPMRVHNMEKKSERAQRTIIIYNNIKSVIRLPFPPYTYYVCI